MPPNEKLTQAIKGRAVTDFEDANGTLTVRFADGSFMRVRATAETSAALLPGAEVVAAFDGGGRLELSLQDGRTVGFALTDPARAVSVWDPGGKMLYLG